MKTIEKLLDYDLYKTLAIAQNVIESVTSKMPFGPGNNVPSDNLVFDAKVRKARLLNAIRQHDPNWRNDWTKPCRSATRTLWYQGGSCQEYAAISFSLLREKFDNSVSVYMWVDRKNQHAFVTINNPQTDPQKTVAVDAWPIYPKAVLWEDFWCSKNPLELVTSKPCGKKDGRFANKMIEHQVKYEHYKIDPTTILKQYENAGFNTGDQTYAIDRCGSAGNEYVYKIKPRDVPNWSNSKICASCHKTTSSLNYVFKGETTHHCRSCGETFCRSCSNFTSTIYRPANKKNDNIKVENNARICKGCMIATPTVSNGRIDHNAPPLFR